MHPINQPTRPGHKKKAIARNWLRSAIFVVLILLSGTAGLRLASSAITLPDTVDLGSTPSAKQEEPSNVSLALSVEFPTVGAAYRDTEYQHDLVNHPYIGYWDINSCYLYKESGDSSSLNGEYFYRVGATDSNGYCSNAYSGNLLNYVASSAIDVLRLALTGGNRVLDTSGATVLERAYLYKSWGLNQSYFPVRKIKKSFLGQVMPNGTAASGDNYVYGGSCQNKIWLGTTTANGLDCGNPAKNKDLNPFTGSGGSKVYLPMYARVKVCTSTEAASRTDLCTRYPSGNYKPTGQIQKKSDGTRLAAFGYAAEDGNARYGGVLRAPMAYLGPTKPTAGGNMVANAQKEWDASTGVFVDNPRSGSYTYSGVINYVNRFGTTGTPGYYKGNDPVGELYYEALRYYMGLGPTDSAISNLQASSYDGFPIYKQWDDPIQNACQRKNYVLIIGDVNTWYDKQLPGHGSSSTASVSADANDPARSAENLLGSGTFDAVYWTKIISNFETGANTNFTNSLGVSITTQGNPNPNANNNNLNSKATGAGGAAYYWAGAAYWAHTQPIRNDNDGDGKSKSLVRVNTFAIDVDENGNGDIENTSRGIPPRQSSFYLAGKYGWFNNTDGSKINPLSPLATGALGANEQLDGHPFRNVLTGALDNTRWEYAGAPNTPDGYVIASQAKKMMEGVSRFFNSIGGGITPSTVMGLSSINFSTVSPDGAMFVPQFDSKTWGGRLLKAKMTFSQPTGELAIASTLWDAGKILTDGSTATGAVTDPQIKPVDRKLFTYSRDGSNRGGQALTVAGKGNLDADVLTALAIKPIGAPPAISDSDMQDATINWLRGDRSLEAGTTGGYLRVRTSILGAIVNSGPVYKQGADSEVTGDGFAAFAGAQKTRAAAVYVGANDGFMHAFRASDGKELFAYMPRAVAESARLLAAADYAYRPFVDAIPLVTEAQQVDGDGKLQWKTLLVSGMGGGAQGVFALDVTDPTAFDKTKVLFEFTDRDDPDMGNVVGSPKLVRMKIPGATSADPDTYRWFVAVSSGYNNYKADGYASANGAQALFLLSVDKSPSAAWSENTNYFKMKLPQPTGTRAAALTNPGVATDVQGNAVIFYAGDTYGNVWKFDFLSGLNAAMAAEAVTKSGSAKALAILKDSANKVQPITTIPQVAPGLSGGYMVIVGTGKFIETGDAANTEGNSVYGIWDDLGSSVSSYELGRSKFLKRAFTGTGVTDGAASFIFGDGVTADTPPIPKYRGWYLDLPVAGERVVVEPDTRFGYTAINSFVPPADCSANGTGAIMTFDNLYGSSRSARDYRPRPLSRPRIVALDLSATDAYTYTARLPTGRRDLTVYSRPVSSISGSGANDPTVAQGPMVATKIPAGRVGWREIKNF